MPSYATCQLKDVITTKDLISAKDINSCVSSYVSSLRYLKKIVPLTIYNIIYNRIDLDENLFDDQSICEISFKTFKRNTPNGYLTKVYYWCKGIVDALEKKNLSEVHLLFRDEVDNRVIEHYKYKFLYTEDLNPNELPSSEKVINYTRNFFDTIKSLSEYIKLNKGIDVSMEIALNNNVAPEHYIPPHFDESCDTPYSAQAFKKSDFVPIAQLNTGYHKLRCAVKGAMFESPPEVVEEREASSVDADELINMTITDKSEDVDVIQDETNFRCPCSIQDPIEAVMTIKCTSCSTYQHLICIGYISTESVKQPYLCVSCHETPTAYFPNEKREQWKLFCGYRLVLYHCHKYETFPSELINRLDDNTRTTIMKSTRQIIKSNPNNSSYTLYREKIINMMPQLFADYNLPESMML